MTITNVCRTTGITALTALALRAAGPPAVPEESQRLLPCDPEIVESPPPPVEPPQEPRFRGFTLTGPGGLPPGRMQVVTFYDGWPGDVSLRLEYVEGGASRWLEIDGIEPSTSDSGRIGTYEYDLARCRLTGRIEITGIVPNGVIDGLAFGLFWRDDRGFHLIKSVAPSPKPSATFVGAWPLGLNDRSFAKRTPQLEGRGLQHARMIVSGAEYLEDGRYLFALQERVVRLPGDDTAARQP